MSGMTIPHAEVRKRVLKVDEAVKPWYARHITHAISTRIVWLLQGAPMTPDFISLAALVIGMAGTLFFSSMHPVDLLTGALLVEFYYVLDAVDGQWARFKKMQSLTGAFFDSLGNYLIEPCILFSLSWGLYTRTGDDRFLLLGFSGAFSTLWLLVIWNIRASVLLEHLGAKQKAPFRAAAGTEAAAAPRLSPLKFLFSLLHKSMVFPWFMNILSAVCAASYFVSLADPTFDALETLAVFVVFYGLAAPTLAFLLTAFWIVSRKLDRSPELG
jgi:phosphatidylglycerophosphate synthase